MHSVIRWHHSIAAKSFGIGFVVLQLPLLALTALIVLRPGWLTPAAALGAALVATVPGTVLALLMLHRWFRPLRQAADGLRDFMTHGHALRLRSGAKDEVGRLVKMMVLALAYLDRSRAPLLNAGALTLDWGDRAGLSSGAVAGVQCLALVEVDQWQALDEGAEIERLYALQTVLDGAIADLLGEGECVLPWGRGRFLLVMKGSPADAFDRLDGLCRGAGLQSSAGAYTCSAAIEPRSRHASAWPASLQRLEHKLFGIRLGGKAAQIA